MEKAKVYFTNMRTTPQCNLIDKMERVARRAGIADIDFQNKFAAIKIHFGEPGNLAYLRPQYAARMAAIVRSLGGRPFLTDSNTLYTGKRANAVDHLQSAMENGYNVYKSNTSPVIIFASECPRVKVIGNNTVDAKLFATTVDTEYAKVDFKEIGLYEAVDVELFSEILSQGLSIEETLEVLKERKDDLISKHITRIDILSTVNYNLGLKYGIGSDDDIDHLANRRIRSVGELLQNQFRIGISRLERVIRERMAIQEPGKATPQTLINVRVSDFGKARFPHDKEIKIAITVRDIFLNLNIFLLRT